MQKTWQLLIGEGLRLARVTRRETLRGVSQAVHVHHTDISKIERGIRADMTMSQVVRLAQHYDLCLAVLVADAGLCQRQNRQLVLAVGTDDVIT